MKVDINNFSQPCKCGRTHSIAVKEIYIESGAVDKLEGILAGYKNPTIVCDNNTYNATKDIMKTYYETLNVIMLMGDNIHADDAQVEKVKEQLKEENDIMVAVGSGTVHDITRFVSYEHQIPFISVPTAASVDGFVSTVACLTWKGMKKTLPTQAPAYVLADTDIFGKAPFRLTASGISDLLGKYTALLDWKICHHLTGEYLCETIYELEDKAVREVESVLDDIKKGEKESMEKLMYALILSGLAMQMIGNSRPASGAEHHMSHLWEMSIINDPVDALHGEKVSVGLIWVMEYYEKIKKAIYDGRCEVVDCREYETELLLETFGKKGFYQAVLEENDPNLLEDVSLERLRESLDFIAKELDLLPTAKQIKENMEKAGCVTTLEEIHLPESLGELSLQLCPYVRRRLTLLRISKLLKIV